MRPFMNIPSFQYVKALILAPIRPKPLIQLFVEIDLYNKNGKRTKHIKKECHSYVRQLIDMIDGFMSNSGVNCKDTGGTNRTNYYQYNSMIATAAAGDNSYGIIVGIGNTAVTISDYVLDTTAGNIIAHGNAATQLSYGSVSVGAVAIVGSTAKFTIARTLTNNSGADITVNEVCLTGYSSGGAGYKYMFERTLLTFTVANGTSGTVTYTISVTV
jgi:hypothetical protein